MLQYVHFVIFNFNINMIYNISSFKILSRFDRSLASVEILCFVTNSMSDLVHHRCTPQAFTTVLTQQYLSAVY